MKKEPKIILVLFAVFIVLQSFDIITTNLAFAVGLGEYELNPLAAILINYDLLWLGKAAAIAVVSVMCYWLWKKSKTKMAIKSMYAVNSIYVGIVTLNLLSLGMVM